MSNYTLTPVEQTEGYFFKREDLYKPFDGLNVNGGKLRQCMDMVISNNPEEIITFCSINSPQLGIVSAVGNKLNIPVRFLLGGTSETPYTRLAESLGAVITRLPCARDSYLYSMAKKMAHNHALIIKSGIIDPADLRNQVMVTAEQAANIPDQIEEIVVTCGSGLTTLGLIIGICNFKKKVKKLALISTAPDRAKFIEKQLKSMGYEHHLELNFHSLFDMAGYSYEKKQQFRFGSITFHPRYEAKTFSWYLDKFKIDKEKTLFWIVGGEII